MAGDLIYEPRAIWSVGQATPTAIGRPVEIDFPRQNWRNGGRWPIVLEQMLIAPVGYLLEEYRGAHTPPIVASDRHDCAASIQVDKLFITAPGRQHYTLQPLLTGAFPPQGTADVSMRDSASKAYASGLFNVCRWDFSKPLDQPRGYGLEFSFGGFLVQPNGTILDNPHRPHVRMAFFERGGRFGGNARVFQPSAFVDRQGGVPNNFPFPADGLGSDPNAQGATRSPFTVDGSSFRKQQSSQSGREQLTGFAVHIDAIGYEDTVQASGIVNVPGAPIAAESLRTPVACKTAAGVTDTDWWRPGAPLALVCPTLTPAQVYKLREPIVLHPGDTLDVLAVVPGGILSGTASIFPTYQLGVSFTGYAIIEG
jgi:hypothetical protein